MKKWLLALLSLITFTMMIPVSSGQAGGSAHNSEEQYDGPYVQYKGNQIFVKYVMLDNGMQRLKTDSVALRQKGAISLSVITDVPGRSFTVQLKKNLKNEKSEFPKIKKLLVLSDIEGNFAAFRKLLQAGEVMDEDFNWTFTDGHLVLIGDFFDRGEQVTETLWLIYYLEEKAKAAGGYVHFILGNHEIMNLSGDERYINQKYLENAAVLNQTYIALYDKSSELGRWLRTKNIVEKIGDIVFAHGGISGNINRMNVSIQDINELARPYYDDTAFAYPDQRIYAIFDDPGPFWYRGYYEKNNHAISLQIDTSLSQFGARQIITGHTIIGDTISALYNGRLLNTDVHHAAGKSEALFIENNKYYRINAEGKKNLLLER